MRPDLCPCGGASPSLSPSLDPKHAAPRYAQCCGRFIDQGEWPATALELMRSRYTAYVLNLSDYLRSTWSAATCPPNFDATDPDTRWLGLQIKRHTELDGGHAEVEFVARYKVAGRAHRLHELSRFIKSPDNQWIYLDGQELPG
jgi:SEC-C motif domain protein